MTINYPYTGKNLLEESEKYEMTLFQGLPFLQSYAESRKNFLDSNIDDLTTDELLCSLSNKTMIFDQFSDFLTFDLFSNILKNFFNKNFDIKIISVVNIFVRKFEIVKKIYLTYDKEFKKKSSEYCKIKNYILLSLICEILFEQTLNLKYLNISLKLNDLICSQNKKLNKIEKSLSKFIIKKEIELLRIISEKKGVHFL